MKIPVLALAILGVLCGCGGGAGSGPGSAPSPFLVVDGNWEAGAVPAAGSTGLPMPIANFTGALHSSQGVVTGTMRAFDPTFTSPCVGLMEDLAVTGTIDAANHLTLTVPISKGVATIQATLTANLQAFTSGTYQVVGGACAMPPTTMNIEQFLPLTGTYAGTLSEALPANGLMVTVTAMLTQATAPDVDGRFPLSGTVTVSGGCAGTYTFSGPTVSGNGVYTAYVYPPPPIRFSGAFNPTATMLQASLTLNLPGCANYYFNGPLAKQ